MCCSMVVGMPFCASNSLIVPFWPFGRGAVVAPDVEDQRVVAVAELVDLIHDAADLHVHVLGEPGVHLHQAALKRLLVLGDRLPGRQRGRAAAVSSAFCGIQPSSLARWKARSRYLSQPSSNLPLYLSAHSFGT